MGHPARRGLPLSTRSISVQLGGPLCQPIRPSIIECVFERERAMISASASGHHFRTLPPSD
jgi:hypothetical protein